ncbi:MAG: hypothetical protein R3F59_37950 [Myxococcota bacterium]
MLAWLVGAAWAQAVDTRAQLADALLLESQGDLDGAMTRYQELARTLADTDPVRSEALYWLGHGLWSRGEVDAARAALQDGIRTGECTQCRDLLEVIDIDDKSLHTVPATIDFSSGNQVLFHPWRTPGGNIEVAPDTHGDPALHWTTMARPGEPDRLVLGLQHPTPRRRSWRSISARCGSTR